MDSSCACVAAPLPPDTRAEAEDEGEGEGEEEEEGEGGARVDALCLIEGGSRNGASPSSDDALSPRVWDWGCDCCWATEAEAEGGAASVLSRLNSAGGASGGERMMRAGTSSVWARRG